jgi:AcrR family transcriptional regulator
MLTAEVKPRTARRSATRVRQLRVEYRRRTILDAARTVFARSGFAGTTVDLIAQEADVAKGTLYLYYPSKSAIYAAAVVAALEDLTRETVAVLETGGPTRNVLRAFFETRWRFFERHAEFFRIYTTEKSALGKTGALVRRASARLHERQVKALERVLEAGVRAGELRRVNPRTAARVIFDLSYGVIVRRLRGFAPTPAPDVDEALELLWKGLAPR